MKNKDGKKNDPRASDVAGFFMSLEFIVAVICGLVWLLYKLFG